MSTLVRDTFILEMEDNLKMVSGLGFDQGRKWEQVYTVEPTNKRRVEVDEYVHPSVVAITQEGAPFNRLAVRRGYNSYVVPDTLTGEVKISHEFMRDNKYKEIGKDSFGLGKAMQRKRYKDAMAFIYNTFSSVKSPDAQPVCSDSHALVNGGGTTGDNLVTGAINSDNLDAATTLLTSQVDENGDILTSDLGSLQLLCNQYNFRECLQLIGSTHEPENMNNAVNVFAGSFGEFNIEVIMLPLLLEAPAAYRQTQWYLRDVSEAENYFYEREKPETWVIPDQNSLCSLHQCKDAYGIVWHNWRGFVGSKGL